MSVAKVIELTARSDESFEDAIKKGIARANKTLKNIEGAWIKEQKVAITDGEITGYHVNLLITFVLENGDEDEDEEDEDETEDEAPKGRPAMGGGAGGRRR
jgi:flavin-binding protein dodecin